MAKRTSFVTVNVAGLGNLRSMPGASFQGGGIEREGEMTDQGVFVYGESLIPAQVTCEIPHMSDTDLPALRAFNNGTVRYSTDSGLVYVITDACTASVGELANGKVTVTFIGTPSK